MDHRVLSRMDVLGLIAFCAVLFGICMVSERPLSIHEAVLPVTSRLMLADGDLVVPKTGNAPWLESPPLPQWISTILAIPFGHVESHFVARLGNVVMATLIVLMAAWMSTRLFGRNIGLLTGLILATMVEFTKYAWLAEDEIYLCAVITSVLTWFVWMEFPLTDKEGSSARSRPTTSAAWYLAPFTGRSWTMLVFFVLLGMTNLCKGILFGMVVALVPCVSFIVLQFNYERLKPYLWVWGVLTTICIGLAWPFASYLRYPDVIDLWRFDLGGRVDGSYAAINEPIWYYPVNLLWMIAPWTFAMPAGLWMTRKVALKEKMSAERFVWCWAILLPAVLSIPAGKHHHYMLHGMIPWAMLSSIGLVQCWAWLLSWPKWLKNPAWSLLSIATPACLAIYLLKDKMAGPEVITYGLLGAIPVIAILLAWGVTRTDRRIASGVLFGVIASAMIFGHLYAGRYLDKNRLDAQFCQELAKEYEASQESSKMPLLVDCGYHSHRAFLCQFYLPTEAKTLPNLSFLHSSEINSDDVLVVSISGKQAELEEYGEVEIVRQIEKGSGGRDSEDERLTVYHVHFPQTFEKIPTENVRVSPMQAINRAKGPDLTVIR